MSSRLPVEVNPFRLVEQRKSLTGSVPLRGMERLNEMLESSDDAVTVSLDFTTTDTGLPAIEGSLQGTLRMTCQRCLRAMQHPLQTDLRVVLVQDDEHAGKLQQGFDAWVVEDDRMHLSSFIEDEILLTLPLAAMHEQCEPAKPFIEALPEDELTTVAEARENPFSVLQSLKDSE